jgi:hypothetical protein
MTGKALNMKLVLLGGEWQRISPNALHQSASRSAASSSHNTSRAARPRVQVAPAPPAFATRTHCAPHHFKNNTSSTDAAVGKSSCVERFVKDEFFGEYFRFAFVFGRAVSSSCDKRQTRGRGRTSRVAVQLDALPSFLQKFQGLRSHKALRFVTPITLYSVV